MAYDLADEDVVLFGGLAGNGRSAVAMNDTWVWSGTTWSQVRPRTRPRPRYASAMAYDAARKRIVLFGGIAENPVNETWLWNGKTWTEMHAKTSPSPRSEPSMTYDRGRSATVLYGGSAGIGPFDLRDTWELKATAWARLDVASPKPSSLSARMVFDARQGYLLLTVPARGLQTWVLR